MKERFDSKSEPPKIRNDKVGIFSTIGATMPEMHPNTVIRSIIIL